MTEKQKNLVKELDQLFKTHTLEEFVESGTRRDLEILYEVLYECKPASFYRTKADLAKQLRNFVQVQRQSDAYKHIVV